MRRIFQTGLLLATCMMASAGAQAGFEFVPPPQKAAMPQNNSQGTMGQDAQMMQDGAMPSAPMAEVTAEPLSAPPVNQGMPLQTQRETVRLMPSANEAIDTRGLLAATSQGRPVSIAPQMDAQPAPRPAMVPASGSDRLVINPYPLRGRNSVSSNPSDMALAGAMVQPAAMPSSGQQGGPSSSGLSLMPMPGGEGTPIYPSGQVSSYAPAVAKAPEPVRAVSRSVPRGPDDTAQQAYPAQQAASGNFGEAVGFGRDLPLALAMSQIVPAQYTYSFDGSVDKGATVSWQGGKPWNVVLDEMLAPSGMRAVINNTQVTIVKAG